MKEYIHALGTIDYDDSVYPEFRGMCFDEIERFLIENEATLTPEQSRLLEVFREAENILKLTDMMMEPDHEND